MHFKHPLIVQTPIIVNLDSSPQTVRDWNNLPDSRITSVELSDDCVSKFISLVRPRDQSFPVKVRWFCHFGVSLVNYSDLDSEAEIRFYYSLPR